MGTCDQCARESAQLYDITVWDDQEHERYMYSQVLDEDDLRINFPGRYVTLTVCPGCYQALIGGFVPEPTGSGSRPEPLVAPSPNSFSMRTLQSEIATALAKVLFESCGYEVRHNGYEYMMPEWVSAMKAGDPNPAVARVRAMPDLRVYDRKLNTMYEVEIKATTQQPAKWRCRQDQVDTLRYHHPEAIMMVYIQRAHRFYVQHMKAISWSEIPLQPWRGHSFYQIDLDTMFVSPPALFAHVNVETYSEFLKDSKEVLHTFALQR